MLGQLKKLRAHLLLVFVFKVVTAGPETVPPEVQECFTRASDKPVNITLAKDACWRAYYDHSQTPNDFTSDDRAFFNRYQTENLGHTPPPAGKATRVEIRTLSREQLIKTFNVFTELYKNGVLARFGRLHGQKLETKHKGAAFLPWHRVFLVAFELEMRKVDSTVSLPYWDYTMDYYANRPSDSVIWTDCFLGNGKDILTTGPFAGWYGGYNIEIRRDVAKDSGECPPKLINKNDIHNILNQKYFKDITTGNQSDYFGNTNNLELLHDGVHDWIGGDMGNVPYASYDPVFWMHHAFIDHIWEQFRMHQIKEQVDIETDYREFGDYAFKSSSNPDHTPHAAMHGFEHLQNIHGLWRNWTTVFYNYTAQPSCPDCGNSKYLYCDKTRAPGYDEYKDGVCVTKTFEVCTLKRKRAAEDMPILTRPVPHCQSKHKLKGLPGDGRSRDTPIEDCKEILMLEISSYSNTDNLGVQNTNQPSATSSANDVVLHWSLTMVLSFLFFFK